jgi:hypothetical protein
MNEWNVGILEHWKVAIVEYWNGGFIFPPFQYSAIPMFQKPSEVKDFSVV